MKILLFDVDGTLVDSGGAGRRALDRALERLYGVKNGSREVTLAGKTDLRNFREALQKTLGRAPRPSEVERLIAAYLRCLPAEVRRAVRSGKYRVVPGVRRFLRILRPRHGYKIGLGTGNLEQGARIKLGPSGLNGYFDFGGFGSDAQRRDSILRKAVRRACRKLSTSERRGFKPCQDVFVIGDTALDVAAGRKAGFRTVAVATGWDSPDDLYKARPDHLIRDFRDAEGFLSWLEDLDGRGRRRNGSRPPVMKPWKKARFSRCGG